MDNIQKLLTQVAYNSAGYYVANQLIDVNNINGSGNMVLDYAKSGLMLEGIERAAHWAQNGQMDDFDVKNIIDDSVLNAAYLFGLNQVNLLDTFEDVSKSVPLAQSIQEAVAMGLMITAFQQTRDYVRKSQWAQTLKPVTNISSLFLN
jgi:hypothetical protein